MDNAPPPNTDPYRPVYLGGPPGTGIAVPAHVAEQLDQLSIDGPAGDLDARGAQLRAELDRLDLARDAARAEALNNLAGAAELHRMAGKALDEAVAEARAYGATWQQIADATGMARPSAWKRWADHG